MTTISISGNSNNTDLILGSASGTIGGSAAPITETATSLPVFANKTYVGKYQPGQMTQPTYVAYYFNEDGTTYSLNFNAVYEDLMTPTSYVVENVLLTRQNTPPGHVGEYYKAFDTSGGLFTGYQQTGINFVNNRMYWTPGAGPLLRTTLTDFSNIMSSFYDVSMASLISQQLDLHPSKYFVDPLAFLTDPYMIDSTNITESDLILQQNDYNINYNL